MKMVRAFGRDENGVIAVIFALLLPFVIAGVALGVETGMWLMNRSKLQHIADTAAYSAAIRYSAGATQAQALATANAVAAASEFQTGLGTLTMTFPATNQLSVTVTRSQARFFSALFLGQDFTISAIATAEFTTGTTPLVTSVCMQARAASTSSAIDMLSNARLTLPSNCEVQVNSNRSRAFSMVGGTALTTACLRVRGGARLNGTLTLTECAAAQLNTGLTYADPFVALAEPTAFGTCRSANVGSVGNVTTLTPTELHPSGERVMRFCSGLNVNGTVIFNPGLYIIENGTMRSSSSAVVSTPNGATFYFRKGGAANFRYGFTGTLTPSKTGPWKDVLIFGSRTSGSSEGTVTHYFADDTLTGIIYATRAHNRFFANSNQVGCFQMVSDRITLESAARVIMNCTGSTFVPGSSGGTPGPGVVTLIQ